MEFAKQTQKLSRGDFFRVAGIVTGSALLTACAPTVQEVITPNTYHATIENGGSEEFSSAVQAYLTKSNPTGIMVGAFKTTIDDSIASTKPITTQFGITNSQDGSVNLVVDNNGVRPLVIDTITEPGTTKIVDPQSSLSVITYPSDAGERMLKGEDVKISLFPLASDITKLDKYDGSPIEVKNSDTALKILASLKNGRSEVLYEYGKSLQNDSVELQESFNNAGIEDLSGQGLSSCVVDSDCFVGQQVCVAGTTPNTPQMPGYCVEK